MKWSVFIPPMIAILFWGSPHADAEDPPFQEPAEDISLAQCLDWAARENPGLKALGFEIRAHEGWVEQAGFSPNPELGFEAENFLGTGDFQGVEGLEATIQVSQLIELGGKRIRRIQVAEAEREQARAAYEQARLDVLYETGAAFLSVLAAQERLRVFEEFHELSRRVHETIQATVEAGRDSPVEEIRARVTMASAQIGLERARRELNQARLALVKNWGSHAPVFTRAVGDIYQFPGVSSLEELLRKLPSTPDWAAAEAEIARRQANAALEEAQAVPDLEVSVGTRYLAESDDGALVMGFTLPLPLRNRNQGAVRAARELVRQAKAARQAAENNWRSDLAIVYETWRQAHGEAVRLRDAVLPGAEEAFAATQEGFRQGKFPYLSVLDAQRSLIELREQFLQAALEAHLAFNRLSRLTADDGIRKEP
ncbi:MAG TPA: TolC family protein [bacterium]|nr:TolC family protein [bacterium]